MTEVWTRGPFAAGTGALERRLRRDAGAILRAAVGAVQPAPIVERAVREDADWIAGRRVHALAMGKAAAGMAAGASAALGDALAAGLAVPPPGGATLPPRWQSCPGGHPVPTADSARAGAAALAFVRAVPPGDVLLVLLSGGASALTTLPPGDVPLDALRAVTAAMLSAGASIHRLNAVRKHLDGLKGGGLAVAVRAPVLGLAISDVPGDALDVIGSGPLSPDPTTFADAIDALRACDVWEAADPAVRRRLERGAAGEEPETPSPGDPRLQHVRVRVIAGNATALAAAARTAESLGYAVQREAAPVAGEARQAGARLGARVRDRAGAARPAGPACLLAGGETTVTVRGAGRGGRNQELVLAAARVIDGVDNALVASIGTDGVDGPTDAAGAIACGRTIRRAREHGLDPSNHLDRNDAYAYFSALGDLIVTGPTGTNVMDVTLALVGPGAGGG
jgi:glycerate 2-kinase